MTRKAAVVDPSAVTLTLSRGNGGIIEQHHMMSWELRTLAGELAGRCRDAHGFVPNVSATFDATGRDAAFMLPDYLR